MYGIAVSWSELPRELIRRYRLDRRAHFSGGQREARFLLREPSPRIPIIRDGQFLICRWGNTRRQSKYLPRSGCLLNSYLGRYRRLESVEIPASLVCDAGVWYNVRQGIRGVLMPDEFGWAVCYVLKQRASHPYRNMTRSDLMPVFPGRDF